MTPSTLTEWSKKMITHYKRRDDAVIIGREQFRREYVPTTHETKWVGNWDEFRSAGGQVHFNEDQTEITLTLPEGVKFGITFYRQAGE
jgi:hypothetical protein